LSIIGLSILFIEDFNLTLLGGDVSTTMDSDKIEFYKNIINF
jgi:hypothetical protein